MSFEKSLSGVFESLGKREKSVARLILSDYPVSALDTVAGLAGKSAVSTTTVLRLIGKLGFDSYGAFQQAVKDSVKFRLDSPVERLKQQSVRDDNSGRQHILRRMPEELARNVSSSTKDVAEADFQEAIRLLSAKQSSVYCIGGRYSSNIARLFANYLGMLRDNVVFVDGQPEGWARNLVHISRKTTLVVFDIRRYQHSVQVFARQAALEGAKVILITDKWADAKEYMTDLQFNQPSETSSPMDSLVGQLAFAEILIAGIIKANGEHARDNLAKFDQLARDANTFMRSQPSEDTQ